VLAVVAEFVTDHQTSNLVLRRNDVSIIINCPKLSNDLLLSRTRHRAAVVTLR
jgi:hypothetical protein